MTSPSGPRPPRFSQAQLRDALEGTPAGERSLDPGALIGRARSARARRRGGILAAGLVASVIAVSVGVATSHEGGSGLSAASQLERGEPAGADAGSSGAAIELPFSSDRPLPGDPYADRAPITGTACPAARTDPLTAPSGPGSSGSLLSFAPTQSWVCVYLANGAALATELTGAQTTAAVALLSSGVPLTADAACTTEFGPALRLIVSGAGQSATIDAESYGCGIVTTGTASRRAKSQVAALLTQLDGDLRPLG